MRFHTTIRLAFAFFIGLGAALEVAAENNWPNWRGPNYDGSLEDANPPLEWSDAKNVRWKAPVPGRGSGSPIVWDGQIILLTAVDTGQPPADAPVVAPAGEASAPGAGGGGRRNREAPTNEFEFLVISYSLADGGELWRTTVSRAVPNESGHGTNSFASSSAVTDGQRIYAHFGSHGTNCLDMQGQVIWEKDLGDMRTRNHFGEGASPALVGETLVVPWDQEENSAIFALNTSDGEIRWRQPRDQVTTWATPLAVEYNGRTQIVTNGTQVRSYDLETGELLWSCGGQVTNPIPSPVRIDDFVVCMTGYQGNAIYALPLDARGDITDTAKIRWFNRDAAPYVASPTVYKGQLYLTKERSGAMTSLDARTGEVLIPPTRLTDIRDIYASPVAAADRIYFTSRDGVTTVVRHGKTLEELAINKLGEPVDASPALVGDQILIRAAEHLYCLGE